MFTLIIMNIYIYVYIDNWERTKTNPYNIFYEGLNFYSYYYKCKAFSSCQRLINSFLNIVELVKNIILNRWDFSSHPNILKRKRKKLVGRGVGVWDDNLRVWARHKPSKSLFILRHVGFGLEAHGPGLK